LMYAEAAVQGYGGANGKSPKFSKTAVEAVNVVRARAGVGDVHSSLTSSISAFMKELIRERAVELSFEGHRFNDLRRWRLLNVAPYNVKTRQFFDRAEPLDPSVDPKENKVVGWREEPIITRNLIERHYWLPINTADVSIYEGFGQNPGW
ncbi:MAG TPA: RagB/SusD family nutrient uptake outer membrane protein, partial [Marinilabiliaceae bacterium]|nr:RagB/SusD family nutrient uptake outer membrane protein [Marinilabiliaceae bacterium]